MLRSSFVVSLLVNIVAVNARLPPHLLSDSGDFRLKRALKSFARFGREDGQSDNLTFTVIQEEPFLFANGSGYVPDLMRLIADYNSALDDGNSFSYEIVPVQSWSELLSGATMPYGEVSYGLVAPSLDQKERTRVSVPTRYTSVKVVSKSGNNTETGIEGADEVIVLKDSPLEKALAQSKDSLGTVRPVESMVEALTKLRSSAGSILLTSAETADHLAAMSSGDLVSFCAKGIKITPPLFYTFFGLDRKLIIWLTKAIEQIKSDGGLLALDSTYFTDTRLCPV